jgi:NADPH:quinone reductase
MTSVHPFTRTHLLKALVSTRAGGPDTLQLLDLPEPRAAAGELLIEVSACGVNFPDVLVIADRYQLKPPRPFAPGSEVAGHVIAVGESVSGWQVGDRMVGILAGSGGMAERAVVKADDAFHFPSQLDLVPGAAFLLTYATVLHALQDRGRLASGDTLLILGAAGGVGLAAVQVGRALGARVIGAVSSAEKARAVRDAGADDVLIYPLDSTGRDASKAMATQFKQAVGPRGATVILDPVGGVYAEPALRSIAWQGRYLVVGFAAGIPSIPLNLVLIKGCDVLGVSLGSFGERAPERNAANVAQLLAWWAKGGIEPKVSTVYPLERAGEAIACLASRAAVGKLVVQIRGSGTGV